MKFQITFRDSNGAYEGIRDAAYESVRKIEGISFDEAMERAEERQDGLTNFVRRWIINDEDITIEFDTDQQTATVLKAPRRHRHDNV